MKEYIFNIILQRYPTSLGTLVAEFPVANFYNLDQLCINAIIIDSNFHLISTVVIWQDGIRFSYIEVPFNDLENLILNEHFDPESELLTIFKDGEIIKDSEDGIVLQIQKQLLINGIPLFASNYPQTQEVIRKIHRAKDALQTATDYYALFFLLNELILLISQTQISNFSNKIFKAAKYQLHLSNKELDFVNGLINVTQSYLKDQNTKNMLALTKYINSYYDDTQKGLVLIPDVNLLIFDIHYQDISVDHFILNVIREIRRNEFLNNHYCYCYLSPKRYQRIYINTISVAFNADKREIRKEIVEQIRIVIERYKNGNISLLPSYALDINRKRSLYHSFAKTAIVISELTEKIGFANNYFDAERNILICLILSAFVFKKLSISIDDVFNINFYLSYKLLFSQSEKEKLKNNEDYVNSLNSKFGIYHSYYLKNKKMVDESVKKGLTLDEKDIDKVYYDSALKIKKWIDNILAKHHEFEKDNEITINILKRYNIKEPHKASIFIFIFENLSSLLMLTHRQSALGLFVLTESFNHG